MPKYLVKASYTTEGAKGVQSGGGTSRRDAVARMAEGLGGSLESFYFAFGDTDAYVVLDLPDNRTAAAASIAVNTAGGAAWRWWCCWRGGHGPGRGDVRRLPSAGLLIHCLRATGRSRLAVWRPPPLVAREVAVAEKAVRGAWCWWWWRGSNPRPFAYKAKALPAELSRRHADSTGVDLDSTVRR